MGFNHPVWVKATYPDSYGIAYEFQNLKEVFEMAELPPSEHARLTDEVFETAGGGKPTMIGTACRVSRDRNRDLRFGFENSMLAFYFGLVGI